MEIEVRKSDDIRILIFAGSLDTNTSRDAESKINDLIDNGAQKLLVNFEKLSFISSAGLRVLLATAKKLKGTGGELRICALNPTVEEVLDITGFGSVLIASKTEEEALALF
jgi:anti-sigma B factor antagonist